MKRFLTPLLFSICCAHFAACSGVPTQTDDPSVLWHTLNYDPESPEMCSENLNLAPLVVDWPADVAQHLHDAMERGVVVVGADCNSMRIIEGCAAPGDYRTMHFEPTNASYVLEGEWARRANLPYSGFLERAEPTLVIEMVTSARRSTTRMMVSSDELEGTCEGATHYLYSEDLGSSNVQQDMLRACELGMADDPDAVCLAPLRIRMLPLDMDLEEAKLTHRTHLNTCSASYGPNVDGLCVAEGSETTLCEIGDESKCLKACKNGHYESCEVLSVMYVLGQGVSIDEAKAFEFAEKGCEGGVVESCRNRSYMMSIGLGTDYRPEEGLALLKEACDMGSARACRDVGSVLAVPEDGNLEPSLEYFARGCDGGDTDGCAGLGVLLWDLEEGTRREEAQPLLEASCRDFSGIGCNFLGYIHEFGDAIDGPLEPDVATAMAYYTRACEFHPPYGCNQVAVMLLDDGNVSDEVRTEALALLESSCSQQDPSSCANLGLLYSAGLVVDGDPEIADAYHKKACELGSLNSCARLGATWALHESSAELIERGLVMLDDTCSKGDAYACVQLGWHFEEGRNIEKDIKQARELYEKACTETVTIGCGMLGMLYLYDKVGDGERSVGLELLERACAGGDVQACANLGVIFLEGRYVDRDVELAIELLEAACAQGDGLACGNLGYVYIEGLNVVEPDYDKALTMLDYACSQQISIGCTNLGVLYVQGYGVAVDMDLAKSYFDVACRGGSALGCRNLEQMEAGSPTLLDTVAETLNVLQDACSDDEESWGCVELALLIAEGQGVEQDYVKAAELFQQGCNNGEPRGCYYLSALTMSGNGVDQDTELANELLLDACDQDVGEACYDLGVLSISELPDNPSDTDEIEESLEPIARACELGFTLACADLATLYYTGGLADSDWDLAIYYFELACQGADIGSCNNLGYIYQQGLVEGKDESHAAELFLKACDEGDALGCANYAVLLVEGRGVDQDLGLAITVFEDVCQEGEPKGCANLAILYFEGMGVEQDDAEGLRLLDKACTLGEALSCRQLASVFISGGPVSTDVERGLVLLDYACGLGDPESCAFLGMSYAEGTVVEQDLPKAMTYFDASCQMGDPRGCASVAGWLIDDGQIDQGVLYLERGCDLGDGWSCEALDYVLNELE